MLDAAGLLQARWAPDKLGLLRCVSQVADGRRVYLVGGAVRDLLLDRPSYDIDLMVEAAGQDFARALAGELGGAVSVHVPFGTATVVLPDGQRIDVATARSEVYARPGALPAVGPGGLRQDLARRDFTVNALAMRVDPGGWGQVSDLFGGLPDLHGRRLRILYDESFVEDPTRLVRGIRFERTLGMRLEPGTAGLARQALASSRLDGLGGERLKTELWKLLALPGVGEAAARLADFDGWRLLSGALAGRPVPREDLDRLEDLVADWPGLPPDGRVSARYRGVLAIVLAPLPVEEARAALAGLHSCAEDTGAILQAVAAGRELAPDAAGRELVPSAAGWVSGRPSERFARLRHLGPDALRHLAARTPAAAVRQAIAEHLLDRAVRLAGVDGHWLKAQGLPPGPLFGRILSETLSAVLDGQIAGPEQERAFALARARELL